MPDRTKRYLCACAFMAACFSPPASCSEAPRPITHLSDDNPKKFLDVVAWLGMLDHLSDVSAVSKALAIDLHPRARPDFTVQADYQRLNRNSHMVVTYITMNRNNRFLAGNSADATGPVEPEQEQASVSFRMDANPFVVHGCLKATDLTARFGPRSDRTSIPSTGGAHENWLIGKSGRSHTYATGGATISDGGDSCIQMIEIWQVVSSNGHPKM